ncbi:restriction endonuclease subunit S [Shewanella kaireitica]|uniref:restriction endonuclease subunit S n=1 Tax=Shewanella kaireitica TaxID=212021 RepID=UPI00200C89EA|nr:restriction endonuclease subunit S [Shewanella kaireitica]MCL1095912.1 restriction endonuclease subunit S [Shewanella kaireitica]
MSEFGLLPDGWLDTQLGQIVDYGKTAKKTLEDVESETWILELEDIEKDSSKLLKKVNASERPFKSTKNAFKKGDVLYGKLRPYLNKVIIAEYDGVCTTEIIPIDSKPFCSNSYLFYWLKGSKFLHYVDEVSYGVNMPRLGTKDGNAAPFRLAPLAEQKVIADKLDELLAQVESTKARLDAIPAILKSFRQSVLAAAVSGKLTEEWRGENEVTCANEEHLDIKYEIPEEYKNIVRPEEWIVTSIGNIATFQQGMQIAKSTRYTEPGNNRLPILRIGSYTTKFSKDVDYVELGEDSLIAEPSDIILTRTGETRGRVLTGFKGVFHNNTFRINFNQSVIKREFLIISLNERSAQNYILEVSGRSAQPDLTHKRFGPCPISLPPLSEQTKIVRRVEDLFAFADKVEAQVNEAQTRVNNLTQSILAKAFRGELTAEWRAANPELISGENSAAALLERIKVEREKLKPVKKTRAKKAKA